MHYSHCLLHNIKTYGNYILVRYTCYIYIFAYSLIFIPAGWVKDFGVPETAIKVFRRYMMYDPAYREEYIEYLEVIGQHTEAAKQLAICIDDNNYASPKGTFTHSLNLLILLLIHSFTPSFRYYSPPIVDEAMRHLRQPSH